MSHPVTITATREPHRARLGVGKRLLAAIPLLLWGYLWGIAAVVALVASWFSTLVTGRSPEFLHAFLARYIRYLVQSVGYLTLLGDRFPGFLADSTSEVDFAVAGPREQNRASVGFRLLLAIPVIIFLDVIEGLMLLLALFNAVVVLVTEELPSGLRNITAWIIRLQAETLAYLALLTDRYPQIDTEPAVAPAVAY